MTDIPTDGLFGLSDSPEEDSPFFNRAKSIEDEARKSVDLTWDSPFHTLGKGATQASPGNHKHKYSELTDIPPVTPTEHNHDAQYVNVTGDIMTDSLRIDNPKGIILHNNQSPENSVVSVGAVLADGVYQLRAIAGWQANQGDLAPVQVGYPVNYYNAARVDWVNNYAGTIYPISLAPEWADYGGEFGGIYITRVGRHVTVEGLVRPTSVMEMPASTFYTIGTIPEGARPVHTVIYPTIIGPGDGTATRAARLAHKADGTVQLQVFTATSMQTNGYIPLVGSFLAAA